MLTLSRNSGKTTQHNTQPTVQLRGLEGVMEPLVQRAELGRGGHVAGDPQHGCHGNVLHRRLLQHPQGEYQVLDDVCVTLVSCDRVAVS